MACQGAFCGETLVVQFLIRCPYSLVGGPVARKGALFDLQGDLEIRVGLFGFIWGPCGLKGYTWPNMN